MRTDVEFYAKTHICKACHNASKRQKRVGEPCIRCGRTDVEFYPRKSDCKECACAYSRQKHKEYMKDPVKYERYRNTHRRISKRHGLTLASFRTRLRNVYKITVDAFDAMFFAQGGRCYGCETQLKTRLFNGSQRWQGDGAVPCIDHCHSTGEVRGLLCALCNTCLASHIDVRALRRMADHLERWNARRVCAQPQSSLPSAHARPVEPLYADHNAVGMF